ncbi:MAG: hypothetical protein HY360_03790 [Verrucomicrobia bacterium]|nr:hypothetical protein [Verrucomicrobiota bacterium]
MPVIFGQGDRQDACPTLATTCCLNFKYLWLGLLLTFASVVQAAAGPEKNDALAKLEELCSFHLDFEETAQAAFADGQLKPDSIAFEIARKPIEAKLDDYFVPGFVGKALSSRDTKTSIWINFPAAKNLNTRQGTILFWMKYDEIVTDPPSSLLAFNAPGFMYLNMGQDGAKQTVAVCFLPVEDIAHPQNNVWTVIQRTEPWKPGEWHQVCLTWSLEDMCYYEDGLLLGKQALRQPTPEDKANQFGVVLAGWSAAKHNIVVMDELYIFRSALTEPLIQGTLKK